MRTCTLVVADSEVRSHVGGNALEVTGAAVGGGASNGGGVGPDDLGKVAPVLVGGARLVVLVDLGVVPEIGDNRRHIAGLDTSGNVLAVSATVHVPGPES